MVKILKKFSIDKLRDCGLMMNNNSSYGITLEYAVMRDRAEIVVYNFSNHYGLLECTITTDSYKLSDLLRLYGFELITESDRIKNIMDKALSYLK